MFDKIKKHLFRDAEGDFEQGDTINKKTAYRNGIVTAASLTFLLTSAAGIYWYTRPKAAIQPITSPVEFGAIVEQDFVEKDNQSALTIQQGLISDLQKEVKGLVSSINQHTSETQRKIEKAKQETARLVEQKVREETKTTEAKLQQRIKELEEREKSLMQNQDNPPVQYQTFSKASQGNESGSLPINSPETFGARKLPPRPTTSSNHNPDIAHMQYRPSEQASFNAHQFDSHDFYWEEDEDSYKRNIENYVPTGTFVTAIVTGGADANAGVLGQGDTTPVVFQTVNQGILPNGQKSKLKDCTITASAYGEVSSSRGIVRTDRMSCIQDNGDILDVAIKGTAFNFGRNGIRGTTILKNGKIVQMAGVSGILTGLGETGKALSQTTSTSALGSTTTINGQDAALNLLGNATASVGSKLADYYISLAEMYHPIVEINPGAIVNIVFLEGFPIDPVMAEEHERQQLEKEILSSQSNNILDVITSAPINPLAENLSNEGVKLPPTPFGRQ
ncbi:TrbI/VirB10 family protein [Vibrio maritimus]|uniref:Conjugal transfer protein TraB n=1 Tax=Vibrio mediterranei TaxID=689 RepID=A0A3G4VQ41_9VIBR|nr:TrbI/VirB10 family protein [Vibrio mediterranei]AYV25001.1 conjugal transfer protein TraB [Vibrio mediterranei]MCG9790783.1 conjugal transfer protein TraB [Vibrio mediterranei]